jgi:nucleoside-diphosphate-sugar epimerase
MKDYQQLGGLFRGGSAVSYDIRELADYVGEQVRTESRTPIYLGVFYDPLVPEKPPAKAGDNEADRSEAWKKAKEEATEEARKLLRHQVKDFVAWLKKQKVIEEPKAKE